MRININQSAKVTAIDLAQEMLNELKRKLRDKDITLILGSYFDVAFGEKCFNAAVSVESLHHFTKEEKVPLYKKLRDAIAENSYFILTDYFSLSDEEEEIFRKELLCLKREQEIADNELYHFDTPLTIEHECEALREAGFVKVEGMKRYGATHNVRAFK